jgi:hypothetical protein
MDPSYIVSPSKFCLAWLCINGGIQVNPKFNLKYAMIVSHLMAEDKAKWFPIWSFHVKQYLKGSK